MVKSGDSAPKANTGFYSGAGGVGIFVWKACEVAPPKTPIMLGNDRIYRKNWEVKDENNLTGGRRVKKEWRNGEPDNLAWI